MMRISEYFNGIIRLVIVIPDLKAINPNITYLIYMVNALEPGAAPVPSRIVSCSLWYVTWLPSHPEGGITYS
jgi:hypothetical protein